MRYQNIINEDIIQQFEQSGDYTNLDHILGQYLGQGYQTENIDRVTKVRIFYIQ